LAGTRDGGLADAKDCQDWAAPNSRTGIPIFSMDARNNSSTENFLFQRRQDKEDQAQTMAFRRRGIQKSRWNQDRL